MISLIKLNIQGVLSMEERLKVKKATYHLWTFLTSKLVGAFGAQVYSFAISFYILQMTGSATSFAMNLICSILPRTVMAPFVGYMADRYSRKMIIISSQIISTLAILGLLLVNISFGLSLIAIYITTIVLSIASTFSGIAFSSSISSLVDEKRIQKAMSMNQMSISIATIASPAVGGLLYGTVSMSTFLIIYMMASIIAVLLESTMDFKLFAKRQEVVEGEPKESMLESMKAGLSYVKLQPVLVAMIWISLLVNFFFGAFQVGYSYILIEKLKMPSEHFGLTEGAFAIGMLVLSICLSIRKELKYPFIVSKWGIIVMGGIMIIIGLPLMLTLSVNGILIFYMIVMFGFGAMIILVNTPIGVFMQKTIADDYKGRVFSILETMAMALMPLGMVLYGFLYDLFSPQLILFVSGGLLIVSVLVLARPSVIRKAHPEFRQGKVMHAEPVTEK